MNNNNPFKTDEDERVSSSMIVVPNTDNEDRHHHAGRRAMIIATRQLRDGNASFPLPFLGRPAATTRTLRPNATLSPEDKRKRNIAIIDEALSIVNGGPGGLPALPFQTSFHDALRGPNQ